MQKKYHNEIFDIAIHSLSKRKKNTHQNAINLNNLFMFKQKQVTKNFWLRKKRQCESDK